MTDRTDPWLTSLGDQDEASLGGAASVLIRQKRNHVRLDGGDLTGPARQVVLDRLVEVLREDVRDEEDELLPELQQRLSVAQLRRLGVAWEAVRRTAPTRPHPVVSRRPPGNALAALPLTVLDNLRDACDVAALRRPARSSSLHGASRTLAAVAGRVERAAPFRRGEQPSTATTGRSAR